MAANGSDPNIARESSVAQLGASPARRLYRGRDPERAVSIEDLRAMAHRRLPRFVLEYLEEGAEEEGALGGNRAAFHRWRFLPRALAGVDERDLSVKLLGARLPLPLVIAPTGLNGIFRHKADCLLATAAAEAGIPFVQSAMSNDTIEDVAAIPDLRHWFQLYVLRDDEITESLVARAERAGCEVMVVTTDAQIFGKRSWSAREQTGRTRLSLGALADAAVHPRWFATTLLPAGIPRFRNFERWLPRNRRGLFRSAFWIRDQMDVALDWERVARIRDRWRRPLLIKGVLAPEDVSKAAAQGADGVILSNHGGRQLDWAVAPLDMVEAARDAAGGRLALLMDGGIRTGGDIAKAIALGADAVMVGRAPLYGLAAAGRPGVARSIEILRDELHRDLAFLGCPRIAALGPEFLSAAG